MNGEMWGYSLPSSIPSHSKWPSNVLDFYKVFYQFLKNNNKTNCFCTWIHFCDFDMCTLTVNIKMNKCLTPKIPSVRIYFILFYFFVFFQFSLLDEWTTYFTSFPGTPSMSNSDYVWVHGEFLFKIGIKFIFLIYFLRSSNM
jgi:hypothetical protein